MTNNIDNLNELPDVETGYAGADGDYQAASAFAPTPTPGKHTFQRVQDAENDFGVGTFEYNGKTYLWSNFRVQILGGAFDGRKARLGANTMPNLSGNGTPADDFLRAAKSKERPRTTQQYAKAIAATFTPFEAVVGWEWNCNDCKFSKPFLRGYVASSLKSHKKYDGPQVDPAKLRTIEVKNDKGSPLKVADHVQVCPQCEQEVASQLVAIRFVTPQVAGSKVATVANRVEAETAIAG